MKLHGFWRSSSAWRVRIALAFKDIPYEYVAVDLVGEGAQNRPAHVARNPLRQVPVLELDDGRCLAQSVAIVEYLEERFPAPALLPTDPYDRAWVRQLVEVVNAGVQPMQNLSLLKSVEALGGDRDAWARRWIVQGLRGLATLAAPRAGRFLYGDAVTLADVFLVPQLYNARRFGCDLAGMELLETIEARCAELPAFVAAHPDVQPDAPR